MNRARRRALLGGLCGLAAVLVPLGLDHLASARLQETIGRKLQARLGGQATLERVRLMGVGALRLDGLTVTWPSPGTRRDAPDGAPCRLTAEGVDLGFAASSLLRLRPALSRLEITGARLLWERPNALATLRGLYARARRQGPNRARRSGTQTRTAGLRVRLQMERVRIRELTNSAVSAKGTTTASRSQRAEHASLLHGLDHMETAGLELLRTPNGQWRGTLGDLRLGVAGGARVELQGLSGQARERRSESGIRVQWLRVAGGQWLPPGEAPTKAFRLVADELAPDLLQVRLDATGTSDGEALGLRADLDSRKRTLRSRLAVASLRLGSLYPWPSPLGLGLQDTRTTGSVDFHGWGARQMEAQSQVNVSGLVLRHRRVAPQPVALPPLKLQGTLKLDGHRLTLQKSTLETGGVTLHLEGELSRPQADPQGQSRHGHNAQVKLTLPPTHCGQLLAALPPALIPTVRGMKLTGTLGGHIHLAVDSRALDELTLRTRVHPSACKVLKDAPRADVSALRRPFAFLIRPPDWPGTRLEMGPTNPHWVPYPNLGRNVIGAFLAAEDRNFFEHRGFDLENIRRALAEDLRVRGFAKGASSISQQVTKNVFLDHGRNLSRKLEEAILTWRLEQVLEKRRILEIYLNLVEMGPGIFGVRAASRHYFHREPMNLDPLQAAHLAAITPHPRTSHARFRQGRAGMDWLLHLRFLLFQMHRLGWVDKPTYERYRVRDLRLISY